MPPFGDGGLFYNDLIVNLAMRFFLSILFLMLSIVVDSQNDCIKLSQDILYAVKTGEPTDSLENKLSNLSADTLLNQLSSENKRKAFWLNIYNAYTPKTLVVFWRK